MVSHHQPGRYTASGRLNLANNHKVAAVTG